jgi:HK97 family phage major capsid protein
MIEPVDPAAAKAQPRLKCAVPHGIVVRRFGEQQAPNRSEVTGLGARGRGARGMPPRDGNAGARDAASILSLATAAAHAAKAARRIDGATQDAGATATQDAGHNLTTRIVGIATLRSATSTRTSAMNAHFRTRGLRAVNANANPTALLGELKTIFAEFRAKHDRRFEDIARTLDDQAKRIARLTVGGGGGGGGRSTALEPLAHFAMTGEIHASMSVGSGPDGGFMTTPEMDSEIGRHAENMSPMRRLARVRQTRAGELKLTFATGQAASGWVGEKESRPETTSPKLSLITIPAQELYAMPAATQNLLADIVQAEMFIVDEIANEFTRQENTAFVSGDGVMKPRGFLEYSLVSTADASRAFGDLQYVATGASAGFPDASGIAGAKDADSLATLVYALHANYRANGRWQMNSATAGVVRKLKDGDGRWLWSDALAEGQAPLLLGYPVEANEDMPDIGADSYSIAFGDWAKFYTIVDRIGMSLLRDPYTNKPLVNFYSTKRVGGGVVDSRAVKFLKFSAS